MNAQGLNMESAGSTDTQSGEEAHPISGFRGETCPFHPGYVRARLFMCGARKYDAK